jgi:hypothetical protein
MTSFNILGVCTSRDIFTLTGGDKKYEINQYTLGFSPLFAFDSGFKISKSDLDSIGPDVSAFRKRAFYIDLTRSVFDFLTVRSSDYLIVDVALLKDSYFLTVDGHYFLEGKIRSPLYKELVEKFKCPAVKEACIPCDFLPKEEVDKRLKAYASKLLTIYSPEQIILCEHQHSRLYVKGGKIGAFKDFDKKWGMRDQFVAYCHGVLKRELKGCHVIGYLSNAVADLNHHFGVSPLHFSKGYYSYFMECIDTIVRKLPPDEERKKLEKINKKWNQFHAVKYFPQLRNLAVSQLKQVESNSKKCAAENYKLSELDNDI